MGKKYSHLSSEERAVLQVEPDNGAGIRAIAHRLGRSASTLSREIKRPDAVVYSASYNHSSYQDNYQQGGQLVHIAGKRVVDIPELMLASATTPIPMIRGFGGYTSFDLAAGYRFEQIGALRELRVALNVSNLTNKRHASNLTAFSNSDPDGRQLAFHASVPRQLFLTLDARF